MIIVKTSNGDVFINDKATIIVAHDREDKKVFIQNDDGYRADIEHVEEVIYANDAQPTKWKDEGSAIQELRKTIDRMEKEVEDANALTRFSRQAHMQLAMVVDRVRNQLQLKEKNRTWDDIEYCLASVDNALEEIKKERDKIMAKRLA